ncbi:MAG: DUF4363 family protein [Clostridia bacterium]|nr:DUF4363 family protein [Clostridia bacterium]
MRRTLILTLAVLICALAVCAASMLALNGIVDEAERLQSLAVLAANEARTADAKTLLLELAELWESKSGMLEMLSAHEAVHDVSATLAEAQICLECEDHDDFLRTMSTARAGLEHLKDEEALRLSNLY